MGLGRCDGEADTRGTRNEHLSRYAKVSGESKPLGENTCPGEETLLVYLATTGYLSLEVVFVFLLFDDSVDLRSLLGKSDARWTS